MSQGEEIAVNTPAWLGGWGLKTWNGALALQRWLLIICGVAMVALVTVQVFTRYVMGISILGIEEFVCYAAVWLYFIGSAHGAWERGHISASFVDVIAPQGTFNAGVKTLATILTVLIAIWMTVWAWQYFAFSWGRGSRSPQTGVVLAWVHLIMPITLSLMTLYWIVEAGQTIRNFVRGDHRK